MVENERAHRAELVEGGVRNAEREAFELLPEVNSVKLFLNVDNM